MLTPSLLLDLKSKVVRTKSAHLCRCLQHFIGFLWHLQLWTWRACSERTYLSSCLYSAASQNGLNCFEFFFWLAFAFYCFYCFYCFKISTLERQELCNTYLLRTLDEACLVTSAACHRTLWQEQREFKSGHAELDVFLIFAPCHPLACEATVDSPVATWRQTTGLFVASGSVLRSRAPDCWVWANRHTSCPAVCVSCRQAGCSCKPLPSSSGRCHTSGSTETTTFGLETPQAAFLNNPQLNISAQIISGWLAQISHLQHSDLLFLNC